MSVYKIVIKVNLNMTTKDMDVFTHHISTPNVQLLFGSHSAHEWYLMKIGQQKLASIIYSLTAKLV